MPGGWYVSVEFAEEHGGLGHSWGRAALETEVALDVIDTTKDGSLLFAPSADG